MKKALSIVLSVVMVLCLLPSVAFPAAAGAVTSGTTGDCTWSLDGTVLTFSGNGEMGNYSINGLPWGESITEVIIENGVTNVGEYAFYYCSKLIRVTIPDSVTNIGTGAFDGCRNLTSVTIGNGVTSIGSGAFYGCTGLTSITIPDSVTSIGNNAFDGCNKLTSITVPDSVASIGDSAFRFCTDLTTFTIPSSVTNIGNYVFENCNSLTDITIPDSVTSIGDYAFRFCVAMTNIILPDSVTCVGYQAFAYCVAMNSITIPNSITIIDDCAFEQCVGLATVWYTGSEVDRNAISIDYGNSYLIDATWHYNTCKSDHTFSSDCDATCNLCDYIREAGTDHTYDNACDTACNLCAHERITEHKYDNDCDDDCNICGDVRITEHTYDDDYDTTCTVCGFTRTTIFTITYHLDDGTNALKNPDVYMLSDSITLMDATKVGYIFDGWFLDAEKTEQISVISGRTENLELYAKFTPKTYTATFNDNGAEQSSSLTLTLDTVTQITVNNGDVVDPYAISKPTKNGYVFCGWYNGDQLVTDSIEMDSDLTLTPKWIECTTQNDYSWLGDGYKAFVLGGDTSVMNFSSGTVTSNYTEYHPKDNFDYSSRSEYTTYVYVSGQYTTLKYEGRAYYHQWGEFYNSYLYGGMYYLRYVISTFEIYDVTNGQRLVFVGDQGSTPDSGPYKEVREYTINYPDEGTLTVAPGTLLRITINWKTNSTWSQDSSYTARCSISTGDVREASVSVTNKRTITPEFDGSINAPVVAKTGYDFVGWYDAQGNKMTDTWQYTENQFFTAKWAPTNYSITYNLDGGTNNSLNPSSCTIEDSITLKDPSKPGYTFKGWYSDSDFTTPVTSISNTTGNITLYAKFEVNSYNLTLDANNGVFAPKVTFISDGVEIKSCYLYDKDTIVAYRPADKDGYILAGWYTDEAFTSLFKFYGTITNDITLYAKWIKCDSNIVNVESEEKINVTIQGKTERLYAFVPLADGKITVTSESNNLDLYGILYDASKNVLISADDISGTDLDFAYTYSVKAGQLYYIAVKGNTASTTGQAVINIVWTGDCTIAGTTYPNRQITVVYDTNYTLPQKPIREGYVFLGWFDENDTQIVDGMWNFVTDKVLIAKWEEATYHTVIFKDLAGNIISSETYYLSEDIVAPELPAKAPDETYIYHVKWDNGYTGVCTGDAIYSVVFEPEYIDYTIVFKNWDGTVLSTQTYHYGEAVTAPGTPTKVADGTYSYSFNGWDKSVVACAGNATYMATYASMPHIYDNDCDTTCDNCGYSRTITHNYEWVIDKSETCGETGVKHEECTVCHEKRNENTVIDATGNHHYGWVVDKSETCGEAGIKHEECTVCHVTRSENTAIPATGNHDYDNDCDASCNVCGFERNIEHTYDNDCDEVCNICEHIREVEPHYVINEKTHILSNSTSYPFSLSDGWYHSTNKANSSSSTFTLTATHDCSLVIQYKISSEKNYDKLIIKQNNTTLVTVSGEVSETNLTVTLLDGDTLTFTYTKDSSQSSGTDKASFKIEKCSCKTNAEDLEPDCATPVVCSICGIVVKPVSLVHTYDNDCDTTCNICDYSRTAPHLYEWVVDKSETCGETGVKHEECTVCHVTRSENTVIDATGNHHYGWVVDKSETCGEAGSKHEECAVCHATRNENTVIDATGNHTYEWVVDKSETCGEAGVKHEECPVCHEKRNENTVIDATGNHTYEWVVDKSETCGVAGSKHEECTVCHATRNENTAIDATGDHTYEWVVDKSETCGETGVKHEECTVCHATHNENTAIDATGDHTYDDDLDEVCNVCGHERQVYTPGDIDGVEGINDRDAIYLLMNSFFEEDYPLNQSGDFDGNGEVNDRDAIYLLMYSFFPDDYPLMNQ